jgi:hypothetical protein
VSLAVASEASCGLIDLGVGGELWASRGLVQVRMARQRQHGLVGLLSLSESTPTPPLTPLTLSSGSQNTKGGRMPAALLVVAGMLSLQKGEKCRKLGEGWERAMLPKMFHPFQASGSTSPVWPNCLVQLEVKCLTT